jgi:hypothetical protein
MKGILHKTEQGWVVEYAKHAELPLHPEYVKYYFLDEDAEGGEVEFEIVHLSTDPLGRDVKPYAKLVDKLGNEDVSKLDYEKDISMREIAEQLWSLLDDIDTLSDICKPTVKDPKAAMAFYNNTMRYVGKRFEFLKSDGYKLYTKEEFESLPKSGSNLKPLKYNK